VPEPIKPKDTKKPKKPKDKATLIESSDKTDPNPREVTVEDVSDVEPSKNQPFTFPSTKGNSNSIPENNFKTEVPQNNIQNQERVIEDSTEKEKSACHNTRTQLENPFNLEAEIGKLKIAIPLSELEKHEVYRQQINRSLQIRRIGMLSMF